MSEKVLKTIFLSLISLIILFWLNNILAGSTAIWFSPVAYNYLIKDVVIGSLTYPIITLWMTLLVAIPAVLFSYALSVGKTEWKKYLGIIISFYLAILVTDMFKGYAHTYISYDYRWISLLLFFVLALVLFSTIASVLFFSGTKISTKKSPISSSLVFGVYSVLILIVGLSFAGIASWISVFLLLCKGELDRCNISVLANYSVRVVVYLLVIFICWKIIAKLKKKMIG